MKKEEYEEFLNYALAGGADFAEIYFETLNNKKYVLMDSKLDYIHSNNEKGIGIRIYYGEESYYTSTNNIERDNIIKVINKLLKNINGRNNKRITLNKLKEYYVDIKIPHDKYPITSKKEILYKVDKIARNYSKKVSQVSSTLIETDKEFIIANTKGKYIKSNNVLTRLMILVMTEDGEVKEKEYVDFAGSKGYELFEEIEIEKEVKNVSKTAVEKLKAKDFKGGELPVVIANGFGAVIFHEACGHGLEATSVAPHLSVFSDDLGKKIASNKVTLIDDGTIPNSWGSFLVDDEGNKSERNILIENGVLKKYLVDQFHEVQMHQKNNGCGRRQNYKYATTSRMSNTYLAPGDDKIEDMIKSIKLGVYCEKMSGGSVNPSTGDFNFAVDTARLIKDGKVKHLLKGITLIGNSKEILKNVEMVSDDLLISAGYCGSKSGMIPVTIGQPTIKVSKILVGGKE